MVMMVVGWSLAQTGSEHELLQGDEGEQTRTKLGGKLLSTDDQNSPCFYLLPRSANNGKANVQLIRDAVATL